MRAASTLSIDDRTFQQKFGDRCFCGEPWSSRKRCGPAPDDQLSIQQVMAGLFAARSARCVLCDEAIPNGRKLCGRCAEMRQRERSKGDRHKMVAESCAFCGEDFERRSDKKNQRFCSVSCANKERHGKQG